METYKNKNNAVKMVMHTLLGLYPLSLDYAPSSTALLGPTVGGSIWVRVEVWGYYSRLSTSGVFTGRNSVFRLMISSSSPEGVLGVFF